MALLGVLLILCLAPAASAQRDTRLPNGKSRTLSIVKQDLKKSKRDIADVIKLAEDLQARIFNLMYELQTIQRPSASLLIGARAR